MTLPDPGLLGGGVIAALVGVAFGWTQNVVTGRWLAACESHPAEAGPAGEIVPATSAVDRPRAVLGAAIVAVVGLWWWEVRALAELPLDASGVPLAPPFAAVAGRWLAHTILLWLLAAATWIDLRYRVIPDWVTIPGCLAGLVVAWLAPVTLLPVGAEVPRSFAAALVVPDMLGWAGPLEQAVAERGAWIADHPTSLVAALVMFLIWWRVGTGPDLSIFESPPDGEHVPATEAAAPAPSWPRMWLLAAGSLVLSGAWWGGGLRFEALFTALVGAVVAGGVVWGTRAGASLALRREAMGLGDVTLMAMVGAWLGWQAAVLACFLGVLFGLVHGVLQILRHREHELPFGPSLCAGTVAVMVGWRPLWRSAAASFAETGQLVGIVVAVVAGTGVSLWVWSSLGPTSRRVALVAMLLLAALLLGWLVLLQG